MVRLDITHLATVRRPPRRTLTGCQTPRPGSSPLLGFARMARTSRRRAGPRQRSTPHCARRTRVPRAGSGLARPSRRKCARPAAFQRRHGSLQRAEADRVFGGPKSLTGGWSISGITHITTGFPVTIASDGDNSLTGSLPNGVNNKSLDLPDYTPGNLNLNHNPRNAKMSSTLTQLA